MWQSQTSLVGQHSYKFGARSGISFCKATREFVEKELSALTKTRVSHKTFWDEAQTCASYYRQKKLSKFVAEYLEKDNIIVLQWTDRK